MREVHARVAPERVVLRVGVEVRVLQGVEEHDAQRAAALLQQEAPPVVACVRIVEDDNDSSTRFEEGQSHIAKAVPRPASRKGSSNPARTHAAGRREGAHATKARLDRLPDVVHFIGNVSPFLI